MEITSDEDMNLYICNYSGGCVHVLSLESQGKLLYSFGKGWLYYPYSICVHGELVYVTDWASEVTIYVFNKEGKFISSFAKYGSGEGQCKHPSGLVIDADGFLYVCDFMNNHLQLF